MPMMRTASIVVMVTAMVAALPSLEDRYIDNPSTGNQLLDNIVEKAVENIGNLGWNVTKKVQNGETNLPMHGDEGVTNENLGVIKAFITGLDSLRRSKTASFNADQTELTGTLVVEDATITGTYSAVFPGTGAAPAQDLDGSVSETVQKLFADIVVNVAEVNGVPVPQNIKSYEVRSGHDEVNISGIEENNAMMPLHTAGFRKALRQILEDTMNKNVKVQVNKAIQSIKSEASSK
ncbi:uncharacterized protein LOC123513890 isoform X1 [Portunus trituberculatus]|uniref:uncharacterized protein LOC123513890 isoform X1 n=1 Tax=Portunus trituberculatus TaxID=210409 RepID=UPI001E1CF815|nr:uncharacterized protein LOC123513890 isoform X1 [Portunus trituberculatus]